MGVPGRGPQVGTGRGVGQYVEALRDLTECSYGCVVCRGIVLAYVEDGT